MIHEKTTRKRQENRSMKIENRTPHQDGFYMPGEFEPQDGVIFNLAENVRVPGHMRQKEAGKSICRDCQQAGRDRKKYIC